MRAGEWSGMRAGEGSGMRAGETEGEGMSQYKWMQVEPANFPIFAPFKYNPIHMPEDFTGETHIEIFGAREHNLKNIDVRIPRNQLVVITGLSGSGKSSLAFDTIHAEGQRRYMESFSAYARHFIGRMERPDVDHITGLSPVIAIEQKSTITNPRSTVGTFTEIYDFLRLLYARASEAFSYKTGEKMIRMSDDQIVDIIIKKYKGKTIRILSPLVKSRKGHYRELFEQYIQYGFVRMMIDGKSTELKKGMQIDRYKIHDIDLVVDSITPSDDVRIRIAGSVQMAMKYGKGSVKVMEDGKEVSHFSRHLMCPTSGISYQEPEPNTFSFNSPYGSCKKCSGLGVISEIEISAIIPDRTKNIKQGGIIPLGEYRENWIFKQIEAIGKREGFKITTPLSDISDEALNIILFGSEEILSISSEESHHASATFEGIISFIEKQYHESPSPSIKSWAEGFMQHVVCPECKGSRLRPEALYFKIDEKNIAELSAMDIRDLQNWFADIEKRISLNQNIIAAEILKEVRKRISFLLDVGLDYLSLDRPTVSLSGGESQRIRLATQIGSQLVGVLYILDEPSIGLHQRDNVRLIRALEQLRDAGNTVIIVEHDKETIMSADHVIDVGPGAGIHGGHVIAEGSPKVVSLSKGLTGDYLSGRKEISIPPKRRKGSGEVLKLNDCSGNNLKKVSVEFPLGKFICVTGVSGSGKSTLINETLYPILNAHFYNAKLKPLKYSKIEGLQHIDKVIEIDQSPIGRTPRSNPATYTGVYTDIRNLFAQLPEAKIRGYTPGRFSFNVKGGRCETCQGGGVRIIEMNFLPDVQVFCETCNGKRFNRETLEVRYRGKSISDILSMSIEDGVEFFDQIPSIHHKIKTMNDIGLGYITLGQPSTTLSGGEAQRIKLSAELSKRDTGNTFYILDEPTTGLHFEDVRILLHVLNKLVDRGNTVLVIEHNLDVIKSADYIIDMGPEGGGAGGTIVVQGTPEAVSKSKAGFTAAFLKKEINHKNYIYDAQ